MRLMLCERGVVAGGVDAAAAGVREDLGVDALAAEEAPRVTVPVGVWLP